MDGLAKMLKRVTPAFGSVFPAQRDQKADIQSLYEALAEFDQIRDLRKHDGWLAVETVLRASILSIDERIVQNSAMPIKHEKELVADFALRTAYKAVLGIVYAPDETYRDISKKLELLLKLQKETANLPRASELETPR